MSEEADQQAQAGNASKTFGFGVKFTESGGLALNGGLGTIRGDGAGGSAMTYASVVGDRLRKIRLQKGLSLHDVQNMSNMEFKASVLGAYERGERSISVPRLERLARLYQVPVDHLLPRTNSGEEQQAATSSGMSLEKIRIDLKLLEKSDHPSRDVLQRYLNLVQIQRSDFNGRVLTIRNDDFRALASVLDLSPDNLATRIEEMGIRAED